MIKIEHVYQQLTVYIQSYGYIAIFLMMVTNGFMSLPPSELVLATGGALSLGENPILSFPMIILVSVLGNVVGNVAMYGIARAKGRKWCLSAIERWGKYIHIKVKHLYWMDKMFDKFGYGIIFFTRVAPVIRSAWSIPAGVSKMNFVVFTVFCAIGSTVYALMNGWLGGKIKQKWSTISSMNQPMLYLVGGTVLAIAAFWIYKKVSDRNTENSGGDEA